jgi:hypothetical protein
MEFEAIPLRKEGKLLPHHIRWAGAVRGDLYVKEEHDQELSRVTRKATIVDPRGHKVLLKPLHDVVLLSAKPDWWTVTGWERSIDDTTGHSRAYQQSWILIPVDQLRA